jgi:hypothetical protein
VNRRRSERYASRTKEAAQPTNESGQFVSVSDPVNDLQSFAEHKESNRPQRRSRHRIDYSELASGMSTREKKKISTEYSELASAVAVLEGRDSEGETNPPSPTKKLCKRIIGHNLFSYPS